MVFIDADLAKYRYYSKRLVEKCGRGEYYVLDHTFSKWETYKRLIKLLLKGMMLSPINRLVVSSIDSEYLRILMSQMKYQELYTFDDGTLSISPKGYKFFSVKESEGRLYRALAVPSLADLEGKVNKHYTIYKQKNNSKAPLEYISLIRTESLGCTTQEPQKYSRVMRIMLGQPIYEQTEEATASNQKRTQEVLMRHDITNYLPHPRESYHIEGVEYIDTPLIFEDYILEEMRLNPDVRYEVYSFCSSVMLNIAQSPQLKFYAVRPDDLPERLSDIYPLLAESGIQILNL